jgi:predicted nuclease with TOPRIM domain
MKHLICLFLITAATTLTANSTAEKPADPFIASLQQELQSETPKAKNPEFQDELAKVYATYKTVIEKSIANITRQKDVAEKFSALLNKVSLDDKDLIQTQEQIKTIQSEFDVLTAAHKTHEKQITALHGRIDELEKQDAPQVISKEWWDQFN